MDHKTPTNKTPIDLEELALRIAEECTGTIRPPGMSTREALGQLRGLDPETSDAFERAAMVAVKYIVECINAASPGTVEFTTQYATRSRPKI